MLLYSEGTHARTPAPPPRAFRPVLSPPPYAAFTTPPGFAMTKRRPRGAKGAGKRYEEQALRELRERFEGEGFGFAASPWIQFADSSVIGGVRYCQPDGLLLNLQAGVIVVLEIKLRHTSDAYWQLERLYLPVLRRIFPAEMWSLRACEVVRWYEPHLPFPVQPVLVHDPFQIRENDFGVHILKP